MSDVVVVDDVNVDADDCRRTPQFRRYNSPIHPITYYILYYLFSMAKLHLRSTCHIVVLVLLLLFVLLLLSLLYNGIVKTKGK